MPGDQFRVSVRGLERRGVVSVVGLDDRDDLLGRAVEGADTDAVGRMTDQDRSAIRRQWVAVEDVVHPVQLGRLVGVDLEDHPIGLFQPGVVIAHRCRRNQLAISSNACDLDEGEIEMTEDALAHHLRDVGQMHVEVVDSSRVDIPPSHRIGLVRQQQIDPVNGSECLADVRRRRCSGQYADRKSVAPLVGLGHAANEGSRYGLGMTCTGKPAHSDSLARSDQFGGVRGWHYLTGDRTRFNSGHIDQLIPCCK